eukprot:2836839-Rhodomonas_salina.2
MSQPLHASQPSLCTAPAQRALPVRTVLPAPPCVLCSPLTLIALPRSVLRSLARSRLQVDIGGSVSVLDNTNAGGGGAGLYFFQATARISGVLLLRGNLAKYGGGLAAVSGSTVEVTGEVDVEDNEALGDGGGVYVTVSALNATGLRVRRNTAAADGGGIAVLDLSLIHI